MPIVGAVGTVDRIDEQFGDHCVVVVLDLRCPILGTAWTDRFKASVLVVADGLL